MSEPNPQETDPVDEPVMTARWLHMVRIDGIEHYYWELEDAMDKLRDEPDADFECVTVH